MKNMHIEIEGKDGIFSTSHRVTIFPKHITKDEFAATKTDIKKLVKKLLKASWQNIMITVMASDVETCSNRKDIHRYIFDNHLEMSSRKFNGFDYSDINKYKFVSEKDMLKWLLSELHCQADWIIGYPLNEEQSIYSQELDRKYHSDHV